MIDAIPASVPCADDPDLQFDPFRLAEAKAKCADCWFAEECRARRQDAEYGVWGGFSAPKTAKEACDLLTSEVIALRATGGSLRAIASQTGLTQKQVRTILDRGEAA